MSEHTTAPKKYLKPFNVVAYGASSFGAEILAGFIGTYFMVFMTDVGGVAPFAAGIIFLIARLWDAINDPMLGSISDRSPKTRFGRYRPFLLAAALPMSVFFILCFFTPNLSPTLTVIYFGVVYILYGMSSTTYQIPMGTLNGMITDHSGERTVLGMARQVGYQCQSSLLGAAGVFVILYFGHGEMNARGYGMTALCIGLIAAVCLLLGFAGTRENVPIENAKISMRDQLSALKQNHNIWPILGFVVFSQLTTYFFFTFSTYYANDYIGNSTYLAIIQAPQAISGIVGLIALPVMIKLLGKKNTLYVGLLLNVISVFFFLAAGKSSITLISIGSIMTGFSVPYTVGILWTIIPEIADYGEWKTGICCPAIVFAVVNFAFKFSSAFANLLSGIILELWGYDSTLTVQSTGTQNAIFWGFAAVRLIFSILAILCVIFYKLDPKTVEHISAELAVKRNSLRNK